MAAPTKIRIIVAFAALYLIWGSTFLGIRFAIETIPPFLMAGSRFVLAGMVMFAIAWWQGIGKSSWANWRTSLVIGACLLLAGNGGVTIAEKYIDSGLAALIVAIATSCNRNRNPACLVLYLVGGLPLLSRRKTRGVTLSDRRPTNAVRWIVASARGNHDWRGAAAAAQRHVDLIARIICLFGDDRSRGWIHRLHLAIATLRAGESRHLCVCKPDCSSPAGGRLCRRNFEHAHSNSRRADYRLRRPGNYGAATESESGASR